MASYDCHSECNETFGYGLTAGSVYISLLAAAENRDVRTVLALADLAPDFVRFNSVRRSIQILSCSGDELISTLRVKDAALLAWASRLESSSGGMRANADPANHTGSASGSPNQ